ncbi:MAG TPA: LytTR family DNA-binding domain-containing protein [Chitinophagaceae bacterium]
MPFSRGLKKEILYICISGAFALLVFFLLHPLGYSRLTSPVLFGYGLVSVLAAILYVVLTHLLYNVYWGRRDWTVGLEIIHSLFFLLFVGGSILIYGYLSHITALNLKNILIYFFYTIALGFIPVTIRAVLVRNWRLKKDFSEAKKINELLTNRKLASDEKMIELRPASSNDILKLSNYDLLFVEASENYITVVWESNHAIRKQMIRMTMKDAIKQMNDPLIVFSHRSFIINLRKVQKVSSQSGISTITLKNTETPIPLSGTYKKTIQQKLKEI